MNLRVISLILAVFAFLLNGCVIEGDPKISKARMEVNPAPEMRGIGEHMTTNRQFRFSGALNAGPSKTAKTRSVSNEGRDVDFQMDIDYGVVNGTAEFAIKKNIFLINTGIGINKGLHTFATFGLNTSHFEIGLSGGLWLNYRDFDYEGTVTTTTLLFFQETNDYWGHSGKGSAFMLGGNVATYWDNFGLEISTSIYEVDLELENLYNAPTVLTTYFTANYRIDKHWSARLGAVNLVVDGFDESCWSGLAGVSYTL